MTNIPRRPCPGCGGGDAKFVGSKGGYEIYICSGCESLFTSRLPSAGETEDYDTYYSEENLSVPEFVYTRVNEIVRSFEPYRKTGRILDLGFGAGTMLEVSAKLGWKPFGLEVWRPAVEQARLKGFEVFHGDLNDADFETGFFDVVMASEIIEHLPNPETALVEVAKIVRSGGGAFWATTPSAQSLSYRILGTGWTVLSPPEHLQLYSGRAVRNLLLKSGFQQVTVKTSGLNPYEIAQKFRSSRIATEGSQVYNRVGAAYDLNRTMTKNWVRKWIKMGANQVLNALNLGDSLKIWAVK